jgi:centromeric protein E
MRPLNTKESNANRVWKVVAKDNSVMQTINTGQPFPERVTGRTFFTFDKTFGEDADTICVYDSVAKGIVESALSGINGTIVAYGQTSSGKTFTMQGSGSIEEGYTNGGGGIVHMVANDIFSHVQNTPDRNFVMRVSFFEIYNEEVRDLLEDKDVLAVRKNPRHGVFVNSVEETVTDFEGLLRILFAGEKNRAVASTGMNERSSRSHTIFRIMIESQTRREEFDENDMGALNSSLPIGNIGAVLISTLNLVDLAGSESGQNIGFDLQRQREGSKINQR